MIDPMAKSPFENLWTVKETAAYLAVSTSLVYKQAEAGVMPCLRVGALLRFEPESVRSWARNGGAQSAAIISLASKVKR